MSSRAQTANANPGGASAGGARKGKQVTELTTSRLFAIGLMLFSMFFGAGNLIFPPMLGVETGEKFVPAMVGFALTAVALPVITVVAVSMTGTGVRSVASRVSPWFGLVFSVLVYMSIGSFYGVPRAGAIAYELGLESTFDLSGTGWRMLGTGVFFFAAYLIAMRPGRVVDTLGKVLTPALLLCCAVLCIRGVMVLNDPPAPATDTFRDSPLTAGVLQGYFTMDSIAALAFAIIVVQSLRGSGVTADKGVTRATTRAGFIAGSLLMLVYVGLGLLGRNMPNKDQYSDGAHLLSDASRMVLGTTGDFIFSSVVLLACLTTVVGLLAAMGEFFNDLLPGVSYRVWVTAYAIIGMLAANLGLERILSLAAPLIGILYPPTIALTAITLLCGALHRKLPWTYKFAVYTALVLAILDIGTGFVLTDLRSTLDMLPMFEDGLGWILPTVILGAVGLLIDVTTTKREPAPAGAAAVS